MSHPKPAQKPIDVAGLVQELEPWFGVLQKAAAGLDALRGAYQAVTGSVPEGERRRGVPIFEFKAPMLTADKQTVTTCGVDLAKLQPNEAAAFLVPAMRVMGETVQDAVAEIFVRVNELNTAFNPPAAAPT